MRRACPAGFCSAAARRQPADVIVGLARALSRAARATQPCPPLLTCPRTALSPPSLTLAGEEDFAHGITLAKRGRRELHLASLHAARDGRRGRRGERAGLGMCRQRRHAGREGRRRGVRDSHVARRCREWFSRAHSMSVRSPGQSDRARAVHTAHAKVYYTNLVSNACCLVNVQVCVVGVLILRTFSYLELRDI